MSSNNAKAEVTVVLGATGGIGCALCRMLSARGSRIYMIAWLLDPANDWVTGQLFNVDGGLASVRARARK